MALTKVSYSMIKGAPANVLDFGADPSGLTDSTQAFKDTFAASDTVYIPSGTYVIKDELSVPYTGYVYGDGPNNTILKCDTSVHTGIFMTVDGRSQVDNFTLQADGPKAGTGMRFEANEGPYFFTGHTAAKNIRTFGFSVGFDVNNFFDLLLERCEAYDNGTGVRLLPSYSPSADSGYYTTITLLKCYIAFNDNEGVKALSTINGRVFHFLDSVVEFNGGTYAQIDITRCFQVNFTSCYTEGTGGSPIPWLRLEDVSQANIESTFCIGTGGVTIGEVTGQLTINNSSIGNLAGASSGAGGQNIFAVGSSIGTTTIASTVTQRYTSTSVDGNYEKNLLINNRLRLVDDLTNTSELNSFYFFTKTVTATINANSTSALISNEYVANILVGASAGFASISNVYAPGLVLQVMCSNGNDENYFSVLATNTTGSPITITDADINVVFFRGTSMPV